MLIDCTLCLSVELKLGREKKLHIIRCISYYYVTITALSLSVSVKHNY